MANRKLIAGVDSSTQSCKVVIRDGVEVVIPVTMKASEKVIEN